MSISIISEHNNSFFLFGTEAELEDFVYDQLEKLLNLKPVARQYRTQDGQICDILAISAETDSLAILELKNTEDRYIVQQLTRYYDSLIQEKPFGDRINYKNPVKLISLTPSFHHDNFTDKKYHQLDFEFLCFSILELDSDFILQVVNVENEWKSTVSIDYQQSDPEATPLPEPPRFFLNAVHQDWRSAEARRRILQMREIILRLDPRIKEFKKNPWLTYGARQSEVFAEFHCKKSIFGPQHFPVLILKVPKLPVVRSRIPEKVNRIRLALAMGKDWDIPSFFYHLSVGIKKSKSNSDLSGSRTPYFEQAAIQMMYYYGLKCSQGKSDSLYGLEDALLENLISLAYHSWLKKISS
ncbi:MAG: endonuclease NucS domain-containing protein [Spirulinaceae cyanobacterium]